MLGNTAPKTAPNSTLMGSIKNTAPKIAPSSFTSLGSITNGTKSTMLNMKNSAKTIFNKFPSDIREPIKQSISTSNSPIISIPVIVTLGMCIVLFILVVLFHTQISLGLQFIWEKIQEFIKRDTPIVPVIPDVPKEADNIEKEVEKIMPIRKEVFNIADDKYKYSDAEPLCKAFGAELATYDQVKDAWNKGADWCNYGWVKGQSALYPTQESTYNKLQSGAKDQRMSCGVPGINGGYFDNPDLKFGVNCYGTKPSEANARKQPVLTPGALEYNKKVQSFKDEMSEIAVNPFNEKSWA